MSDSLRMFSAQHAENEWADMATSAVQWIHNIKAEISTPDQALENLAQLLTHCQQVASAVPASVGTPGAHWRVVGEPDPHGTHYDCERSALTMGKLTDDELANAVFLHGNHRPSPEDLISGKAMPAIAYLTAAKERIRWLSRKLEQAIQPPNSATSLPREQLTSIGKEEWIKLAIAVYIKAGESPEAAANCARFLCNEQDWMSEEVGDPITLAQEDIDGRPDATDAAQSSGFEQLVPLKGHYDLNTSKGARRFVAEFFSKRLRRYDFNRYINNVLAADFACALAGYLSTRPEEMALKRSQERPASAPHVNTTPMQSETTS